MHKSKFCGGVIVGILAMAMLGGSGCGESKQRSADRALAQQVDQARRLADRALAMMIKPTQNQQGPVDPEALTVLQKAQTDLAGSISENEAAQSGQLAVARQTLSQILQLKGQYHSMIAGAARERMLRTQADSAGYVRLLAAQRDLGDFYGQVASLSDGRLTELLAQTTVQVQQATVQLAQLTATVDQAKSQASGLQSQRDAAAGEAATARLEARDLEGDKAVKLLASAADASRRADEASAKLIQQENQLDNLQAKQAQAQMALTQLQNQQTALQNVVQSRQGVTTEATAARDTLQVAMAQQRKALADTLAAVAQQFGDYAQAQSEAVAAYEQAARELAVVPPTALTKNKDLLPAQQARAMERLGQLKIERLRLQTPLVKLAQESAQLWQQTGGGQAMPPAIAGIQKNLLPVSDLTTSAQDALSKAVDLYRKASSQASSKGRWSYQGNLALAAYQLSLIATGQQQAEALQTAREAGQNAIESMPTLPDGTRGEDTVYARQLREILGLTAATPANDQPAQEPATTPTEPVTPAEPTKSRESVLPAEPVQVPVEEPAGETLAAPRARAEVIESPVIPADVSYDVINVDVMPGAKRSLDIRLNRKVSEGILRAIALKLKAEDTRSYERTFICYFLPDMEVGAGAWATTHFDPDLKVAILGLTAEKEAALVNAPSKPGRTVIGTWMDNSPFLAGRITIFREGSKLLMETSFKDGSNLERELVESSSTQGRRFDPKSGSSSGDHWLLDAKGDLEVRDSSGLIATAKSTR